MAFDYQQTIISGRLVAEPELRQTSKGSAVLNFRIASKRSWRTKGSDEWQEKVLFLKCVMWGEPAKLFAGKLSKGQQVFAVGELEEQPWEKDGVKRTSVHLNVATLRIPKVDGGTQHRGNVEGDDDIPF